jgi:hypothetical protein
LFLLRTIWSVGIIGRAREYPRRRRLYVVLSGRLSRSPEGPASVR